MRGHQIYIEGIGEAWADTWGTNNSFTVGWGGARFESNQTYHQEMHVSIDFEYQGWRIRDVRGVDNTPELTTAVAKAIESVPEFREKLEAWRKAAVKRLEKSVPRLTAELAVASERWEVLRRTTWAS